MVLHTEYGENVGRTDVDNDNETETARQRPRTVLACDDETAKAGLETAHSFSDRTTATSIHPPRPDHDHAMHNEAVQTVLAKTGDDHD